MSKIIITIVGQDRVGIVAKTCNYLADHNMNILDITQTILQEYFNMMMIVDISGSKTSFDDMAHELDKLGQEIGGYDYTAESLAESLKTVTIPEIQAAARRLKLDTVYFLCGEVEA